MIESVQSIDWRRDSLLNGCVLWQYSGEMVTNVPMLQVGSQQPIGKRLPPSTSLVNRCVSSSLLARIRGRITYRSRKDSKTGASSKACPSSQKLGTCRALNNFHDAWQFGKYLFFFRLLSWSEPLLGSYLVWKYFSPVFTAYTSLKFEEGRT